MVLSLWWNYNDGVFGNDYVFLWIEIYTQGVSSNLIFQTGFGLTRLGVLLSGDIRSKKIDSHY